MGIPCCLLSADVWLRGQEVVFYRLPQWPQGYAEVAGMLLASAHEPARQCTCLYTRFDAMKLAAVVGASRSRKMLKGSERHMFC